ncbi:mitotic spindle assembly checkpoint protein MAD2A-like isoform X2 [Copidosoma floridanum]|uniref:mitotic spindle assembly checkpoint protein MAD2A-like isoform X2 n=1 Tax=Copidosoma floridanum TaxID=29053 RepID=UPI0006C94E08|nr:mitotic spindle assembly checkpoint protein MAD2A-like isoform X2 [Copidosoma floridanum]XP_023247029.1 mitotic spindle assembly checkpoint protein MAD2A-like isoform X2 [Copidosoma floridanum]
MAYVKQKNKCITLQGSAAMVREYIELGMSSILYQREVCPADDFQQTKYHGLNLFKVKNEKNFKKFAGDLGDIENFLAKKEVASVTLALINVDTREYLEKWTFEITYEDESGGGSQDHSSSSCGTKDTEAIQREIRAVIKQILSANSILPLLVENNVVYEIQAQERPGVPLWGGWTVVSEDTGIENQEKIEFRDLSTSVHGVHTEVLYKNA